jgi:hypothetical protein
MARHFVRVLCDVYCDWQGPDPVYRVFVNDELFTERTFSWPDCFLEEMIQIEAEPGNYRIRYEVISPGLVQLRTENMRVDYGPATVKGNVVRLRETANESL